MDNDNSKVWDITWEELEEQAQANERKNNPPKKKLKRFI